MNNKSSLVQITTWREKGDQAIIQTNDGLVLWRIYALKWHDNGRDGI